MTALSDAQLLASTAATAQAAANTSFNAAQFSGTTPVAVAAWIQQAKAAGAALRAAGAPQVGAGQNNAGLSGWCGRPGAYCSGGTKGSEGVEGFSTAGVIWPYELRAKLNTTPPA